MGVSAEAAAATSDHARRLTLVAMTLAGSMILVDQTAVPLAIPRVVGELHAALEDGQWVLTANILPLAAFMVLGGRLGDMFGLRRVFLVGATTFIVGSALAGAAVSIEWLIVMRALQGAGAALMMPTSIAIVSAVFPSEQRGRALGILAGASAFFAALGPFIGGALTEYIDWRAVFFVNVPLAAATILIALTATPALPRPTETERSLDYTGLVLFAVGIGALVLGLGQGRDWGWTSPLTLITLGAAVLALAAFVYAETRKRAPFMEFGLLRHLNFAAANISQILAGVVELGVGFVMPLYLLRILGMDPGTAGLALIIATIPIIVVAPLAGRVFDRVGGRLPLVVGFLALAGSSLWLAAFVSEQRFSLLVPGLLLQGIGLGTVLTVNDPTGLNSVPGRDRGQAAGIINTTEQLGGAVGIAALTAILFSSYFSDVERIVAGRGGRVTPEEVERFRAFILHAEEVGLRNVPTDPFIRRALPIVTDSFVDAFRLTMLVVAAVALAGALIVFVLVRRTDRVAQAPILSRRSRWAWIAPAEGAAVTRQPLSGTAVPDAARGGKPPG